MKYVSLPEDRFRPLSFYLATEDYLAQHMEVDDEDYLFMWQVEPSVIYGRNQVVENEVNLDYCREHGIKVYQRKSGGGCVYADQDNLMLSYVTREENVGFAFCRSGQSDAVVCDERRKCGLCLQPFRDDGAAGAQKDGHRGDGHHS